MGFYEDRLEPEVPKVPEAGQDGEVQTDHSGDLGANVEGPFGQKMYP